MSIIDKFDRKSPRQIELEKKIKTLRDSGMVASADRLEKELTILLNREGRADDRVKPMSMADQIRTAKAAKAR